MRGFRPETSQLRRLSTTAAVWLGLGIAGALSPSLADAGFCDFRLLNHWLGKRGPRGEWTRTNVIEEVRAKQVPAFLRETRSGDTPAILLNTKTHSKFEPLISESVGIQTQLQPTWNNDHGMLRMGQYMIDVDTPGGRSFGEIHDTGLAWRELKTYLPRREAGHPTIIEVLYPLSPAEMADFQHYQRVRRAAVIRAPFTFNGRKAAEGLNNMLREGEHCFTFCKASVIGVQIREIEGAIQRLSGKAAPDFLALPEVQRFLAKAEKRIAGAEPMDPTRLYPTMLTEDASELASVTPQLDAAQRLELANWTVGLDASTRYSKLMRELGVSSGDFGFADAANPRAAAILIYDANPAVEAAFRNATYSSSGKFFQWPAGGQKPLGEGAIEPK